MLQDTVFHQFLPSQSSVFEIAYWGKDFEGETGIDWTLPCRDAKSRARVSKVLRALGDNLYFAPNTSTHNALRIPRSSLRNRIELDPDIRLFGNKNAPGDTIMLERGEGVVMNPAGCGLAMAQLDNFFNVSHVSWRTLICVNRAINFNDARREYSTVMQGLLQALGPLERAHEVKVWLRCFIPPEGITYSLNKSDKWAASNQKLLEYVANSWGDECIKFGDGFFHFDLVQLSYSQLIDLGVDPNNIDISDSYLKGNVHLDGKEGGPRNFGAVVKL